MTVAGSDKQSIIQIIAMLDFIRRKVPEIPVFSRRE